MHESRISLRKQRCGFSVPRNTVPDFMFITVHDLEPRDCSLVPMFDHTHNSLDIVGYLTTTFGCVDNRNRVGRNVTREICACRDVSRWFNVVRVGRGQILEESCLFHYTLVFCSVLCVPHPCGSRASSLRVRVFTDCVSRVVDCRFMFPDCRPRFG